MKDYTLGKDKEFILGYYIKGDDIIIKYASGLKYKTTYTKEVEKAILLKQKEQILAVKSLKENLNEKEKWLYVILFLSIFCGSLLPFNFSICVILGSFILTLINKYRKNKIISDYNKNMLFIKNMSLFQSGIKENMGIYVNKNNKSKKVIKKIISKSKDNNSYDESDSILREPNLNSIDKLSYSTVKEMYDLLERNEIFSKYYENNNDKAKALVLKK